MPWTNPATRSSGYGVTAANWNELANDLAFLAEVAYVEFTANVTVSATTVGTANQIVSAGAITYENVPHIIEFYAPRYTAAATSAFLILRDGSTVLGTLAQTSSSQSEPDLHAMRRLTPSAASHTYNVAMWNNSAGSATVLAGTGGAAGDTTTFMPGFIRITRVPT